MSNNKHENKTSGMGTIYFRRNIFVSKDEMEARTGRSCEEVGYEELTEHIHNMLHNGERRLLFLNKTISEDAYSKITDYTIEQFIYENIPGFWLEMKS